MRLLAYLYRKQLATRAVPSRPRYVTGKNAAHDRDRTVYDWTAKDNPDDRGKTESADEVR